jgi:hypothetical protein
MMKRSKTHSVLKLFIWLIDLYAILLSAFLFLWGMLWCIIFIGAIPYVLIKGEDDVKYWMALLLPLFAVAAAGFGYLSWKIGLFIRSRWRALFRSFGFEFNR